MIYLVLGGARSGKSKYAAELAQSLAQQSGCSVLNIATAQPFDEEMSERIQKHQTDRPKSWSLAEVPLQLADYLIQAETKNSKAAAQSPVILIDCLTLWLNNHLFAASQQTAGYQTLDTKQLFESLKQSLLALSCDVILVANEVGLGVIPMGEINRRFVDEAGRLNQLMAQIAGKAVLMAAGLPLTLKGGHNDSDN